MSLLKFLGRPNFYILWISRIINVLSIHTFFQADEFWQSLEPAHVKVFGYGQLTWEWELGIRGYLFPFLFEICYRVVKLATLVLGELFHLDEASLSTIEYYGVLLCPKLLMATITAVGEYHMILLVRKVYILSMRHHKDDDNEDKETSEINNSSDHYYCTSEQLTLVANVISMTNFFNWFAMTRTFVNSFEMALTSVALCYWDWTGGSYIDSNNFTLSLFWAMMACFVRVSNGLIWFILGGFLILSILKKRDISKLGTLFKKIIVVFIIVFGINIAVDYYFYGYLIFPIFRFLKFNFTSPLSQFYGTAPWNFYLFQGIPILTGSALIPLLYGMRHSLSSRTTSEIMYAPFVQMKFVVLLNIIIFSTLAHKEFRFIYPLQPLFMVIATFGYHRIRVILSNWSNLLNIATGLIVTTTVLVAIVVSIYHESGVISVVEYLHEIPHIESVGFIMPCHSTPWQSHLHRNDIHDLWAISCEPPIHLLDDPEASSKLKYYMDESDYLYDDIPKFIKAHMVNTKLNQDTDIHEWPEYLVIFQHMDDKFMHDYLKNSTYVEEKRFFNSLGHWDSRRAGDVIVYHKPSII